MSSYAYRKAIAVTLQERLALDDQQCRVMYGPKPSPGAPSEVFIAIHEGSWDNRAGDPVAYINEAITVLITISIKAGTIPVSMWGNEVTCDQDSALDFYCRAIITLISGNYDVMQLANTLIPGNQIPTGSVWKFYDPVRWMRGSSPEPRGSAWWGAPATTGVDLIGLSQQLTFADARRAQDTQDFE